MASHSSSGGGDKMNDVNDFLEHYGILGMRWGRRKGRTTMPGRPSRKEKMEVSEDHKQKMRLRKKKLNQMSNTELKTLNERLQLERQYKELSKQDISSGRKFTNDILTNAAKQTATSYVSKYMTKGVDAAVKKVVSG